MTSPEDLRTLDGDAPSGLLCGRQLGEKASFRAAVECPEEVDGRRGTVTVSTVDEVLNGAGRPGSGPAERGPRPSPGSPRPRRRRPTVRAAARVLTRHPRSGRTPVRVPDPEGGFAPVPDNHRAGAVRGVLHGAPAAG